MWKVLDEFLTWAEGRQLHTGFRRSLFQSYVLTSMLYGCQFLNNCTATFLDKKQRQWGRRLYLLSPQVLRSQFNLFGRLCSADPAGTHRGVAARVFRYALRQQHSWVQEVNNNMRDCHIHAPHVWGVTPGCSVAACARLLDRHAVTARRAEVMAVPSLRFFAECHPRLNFCSNVHS